MEKDNRFLNLYLCLLQKYGYQNWWPLIEKGRVVYRERKKIGSKKKFEIMVGAVLTQNTAWKNVEKALLELHNSKLLSVKRIYTYHGFAKEFASYLNKKGYSAKVLSRQNVLNYC